MVRGVEKNVSSRVFARAGTGCARRFARYFKKDFKELSRLIEERFSPIRLSCTEHGSKKDVKNQLKHCIGFVSTLQRYSLEKN